jgi:hypothetical protein
VKDVVLVPAPSEIDQADSLAEKYFKAHADGREHLLVYNGELHDATLYSTRDSVRHDPEKLKAVIQAGKPMIFFHNHPAMEGRIAMFPSSDDFGVAGLFSFMAYRENPSLSVEFRVMQLGTEVTSVAYGFKSAAVEDIKKFAQEYRNALLSGADVSEIEMRWNLLDDRLVQDSSNAYLQFACPVDLSRKDAEVCGTHRGFFIHYRPQ